MDGSGGCVGILCAHVDPPRRTDANRGIQAYGLLRHLHISCAPSLHAGEMRGPSLSRRLAHLRRIFAGRLLLRTQALRPIVFLFQGCSRDLGLTRNINEGTGARALVQAGAGGGLPSRSHEALHSSGADARLVCVDS